MKYFQQLFESGLQEIFAAEKQILRALPTFIKAAAEPKLKKALRQHLEETEQQIFRLEDIANLLDIHWDEVSRDIAHALLQKGEQSIQMDYSSNIRDAAIIAAVQCVAHYEIAVYGTLKEFARILKCDFTEKKLNDTLKEEERADRKLSVIAKGTLFSQGIYKKAYNEECA